MKRKIFLTMVLLFLSRCAAYAGIPDREAMYYANVYADHYGVPRPLVYAIIDQESAWNPRALSDKGAMALGQLMPATARRYGVQRPFVKSDNIGGCVRYLHDLLSQFHGDMRLAVAAYYTGEKRIARRGLALRDPDVVGYVAQVRQYYLRELKLHSSSTAEGHP